MESKIQEIKDHAVHAKQHDFFTEISYEHFDWLIKQAETLQQIRNEAEELYDEEIDLTDFGERVANII